MATISVAFASQVSVTQTFDGDNVSSTNNTILVNGADESGTYTSSTSPPVTKVSSDVAAMTAGALTIDLTALPGATAEETVVGTGLKLQFAKFLNPAANANPITIAKGASNGYGLDAAETAWSVTLDPGNSVLFFLDDSPPDVASGKKTIDVTGTGSQNVEYMLVLG